VAVTRRTEFVFTRPLAANFLLSSTNYYASGGGRKILSRIELSSDRTKATLFYLEPLPGSTRVSVFFDGPGLNDSLGRPLDPAGTGTPYGLKVISFDTLSLTPLAGTAVTDAGPAPVVSIFPQLIRVTPDHALSRPPSDRFCRRHFGIDCYLPRQLRQAYGLPALARRGITGKGQTIVVVDSFGSPTVRHDLKVFDRAVGLPDPPSLKVIQPAGKVPPYRPNGNREGWAGETELDVEYAHAMAPGASILVVATPTSENEGTTGFPQIVAAEKFVIRRHLGGVISQSFGATEQTFPSRRAMARLRGPANSPASCFLKG
jgi:hypothetical protein